jgi:hypothetical protein
MCCHPGLSGWKVPTHADDTWTRRHASTCAGTALWALQAWLALPPRHVTMLRLAMVVCCVASAGRAARNPNASAINSTIPKIGRRLLVIMLCPLCSDALGRFLIASANAQPPSCCDGPCCSHRPLLIPLACARVYGEAIGELISPVKTPTAIVPPLRAPSYRRIAGRNNCLSRYSQTCPPVASSCVPVYRLPSNVVSALSQ